MVLHFFSQLAIDKSEVDSSMHSQFVHDTEDSPYIVVEYNTKLISNKTLRKPKLCSDYEITGEIWGIFRVLGENVTRYLECTILIDIKRLPPMVRHKSVIYELKSLIHALYFRHYRKISLYWAVLSWDITL